MIEGDLYWSKPAGWFTLEDKRADGTPDTRRLVLVASGTGLAPFISYILHLKNIESLSQKRNSASSWGRIRARAWLPRHA
jgi:ferredoxin-NADP reductase